MPDQDDIDPQKSPPQTRPEMLSLMASLHDNALKSLQVVPVDEARARHELSMLHVSVSTLAQVLRDQMTESPSAEHKREHLAKLIQQRGAHLYSSSLKSEEHTIEFAVTGLKGMMLANGGALIAMLTFIGNYKAVPLASGSLWTAFITFVVGLSFVIVALLFAYLAQGETSLQQDASADKIFFHSFDNEIEIRTQKDVEESKHLSTARWMRITAIVCAALSGVAFMMGCGFGIHALSSMPSAVAGAP